MRCILFDLDGVLINTRPLMVAAFAEVASALGLSAPPHDEGLAAATLPPHQAMRALFPGQSRALSLYQAIILQPAYQPSPCAGIPALLDALAGERLGVVTSKNQAAASFYLSGASLTGYFPVVITWGETTRHKPDPDPLIEAARRFGASHGIYVGDTPTDMATAVAAGFDGLGALWASRFHANDLLAAGARVISESPQVALAYLRSRGGPDVG